MESGITKIKNKILGDADREGKKIIDGAQKECDVIKQKAKDSSNSIKNRYQERAKAKVKLYKDKTLAQARLTKRRAVFEKRETIIAKTIEEALKEIKHNSTEYEKFISKTIDNNIPLLGGKLTVKCAKQDVKMIDAIMNGKGRDYSTEETGIKGGLILESDEGKKINESLESIAERKRNELRQAVAKIIK